jgi:hypothetical protein
MPIEPEIFNVIILLGRPASGKSEIIDYLKGLPGELRKARFHLGRIDVIDDFPMLWNWFEEDSILRNRLGKPSLHTDEQGYFLHKYFWNLLVERIGFEYHKRLRDDPGYHLQTTTMIEFARGIEHGGYAEALAHLPEDLLGRAGICYVQVSFAESMRKNKQRYNPERPDSILEHGLPDEKMEKLYKEDDWETLTRLQNRQITVKKITVPYCVFENEDDVTTLKSTKLGDRLEQVLGCLWRGVTRS